MNGSFGYDVCVEAVAEINRIDVVTGALHKSVRGGENIRMQLLLMGDL